MFRYARLMVVTYVCLMSVPILTRADEAKQTGWPTAGEAIEAFIKARNDGDVPAFLRTINFREEARVALAKSGSEPTDEQIFILARERETKLQSHLNAHGFIDRRCKVVTSFQDSQVAVRFIVGCTGSSGGGAEPVVVMKFDEGWMVVRGGAVPQGNG